MRRSVWTESSELDDIFLRVLDHLPHKERVRDTVLVCKRWAALCLANPPRHTHMDLIVPWSGEGSYFTWLAKSVQAATHVVVKANDALLPKTSLAQLLTVLGVCSPKLRTLIIQICVPAVGDGIDEIDGPRSFLKSQGWDWENWAGTLRLFKKLDRLEVQGVQFVAHFDDSELLGEEDTLVPVDFFVGMALQSLSFSAFEIVDSLPLYIFTLGRALEALTGLTHLQLSLSTEISGVSGGDAGMGDSIALLTSLRALDLTSFMPLTLSASLSDLSSLASLKLTGFIMEYQHIGTLQALERLSIALPFPRSQEVTTPLLTAGSLTRLTSLEVESYIVAGALNQEDLAVLLPQASLRQLRGLKHLKIRLGDNFAEFTTSQAMSTPGLTHLDLGGNSFTCIPLALAELTGLIHLNLSSCPGLQLAWHHTVEDIIRALTKLRTLDLRKTRGSWNVASKHAICKIREERPGLEVLD